MKTMTLSVSLALAATQLTAARPLMIDGTVCRMNRAVDRLIIGSDAGSRVRIAVGHSVPIRMNAHNYDRADLRPGDRVHIAADRSSEGLVARGIDVTMRVDDALVDSIFRSHRMLTGRFAVREAKTEFFSMRLPGKKYVRVDAKSAYGPNGRVRVSKLRSGDRAPRRPGRRDARAAEGRRGTNRRVHAGTRGSEGGDPRRGARGGGGRAATP